MGALYTPDTEDEREWWECTPATEASLAELVEVWRDRGVELSDIYADENCHIWAQVTDMVRLHPLSAGIDWGDDCHEVCLRCGAYRCGPSRDAGWWRTWHVHAYASMIRTALATGDTGAARVAVNDVYRWEAVLVPLDDHPDSEEIVLTKWVLVAAALRLEERRSRALIGAVYEGMAALAERRRFADSDMERIYSLALHAIYASLTGRDFRIGVDPLLIFHEMWEFEDHATEREAAATCRDAVCRLADSTPQSA